MAKVTITTTSGETIEAVANTPEEEAYYENLPFTSSNVLMTEIHG